MILKILALSFLFLPAFASAHSYNPEDLSNKEAREILCSVLNRLKATGGIGVWPGYNPLETPLIIRFSDHIFGYGDSAPFKGWKNEKTAKCSAYSAPKAFPVPGSPIVPYLDFNGTKAFYFDATVKPKVSSWLLSAIIHERFHRFQLEHFPHIFPLLTSVYTGHSSPEIVSESLLENQRLASHLSSGDEDDWIDFLSIALRREPKLSEGSKNWELGQQIAEGTAVFVQLKAFESIENEFRLKFRETWRKKMMDSLGDAEGVDGVIKWRHYAVGSVACDYLDRHAGNEEWKSAIQAEKSESLFRKLLPSVGLDETSLKARGQAIIASSEGDQMRAAASGLISKYLADIRKVKEQIAKSPLRISIFRPNLNCSGGGASEKTYYLPEGGTLGLNYSGSYQCGSEYQETFTGVAALQEAKRAARFGLSAGRIWVDSSELSLRDGSYSFRSIKMEGPLFSLRASFSGVVTISGAEISVDFDK